MLIWISDIPNILMMAFISSFLISLDLFIYEIQRRPYSAEYVWGIYSLDALTLHSEGQRNRVLVLAQPNSCVMGFRLVRCSISLQKCRYVSFINNTKLLLTLYEIKYQRHSLIKLAFELYSQEANMLILPISCISLS